MRTPEKRRKKTLAQTTVEFALVAPFFFAILFAILDYAQLFFYEHSLRYALYMSGRYAMTRKPMYVYSNGVATTNIAQSNGTNVSHYRTIRWIFQSNCVMFVSEKDIIAQWYTELDPTLRPGPGDRETYLRLRASYKISLITPAGSLIGMNVDTNNKMTLSAISVFKLETADCPVPITNSSDPMP